MVQQSSSTRKINICIPMSSISRIMTLKAPKNLQTTNVLKHIYLANHQRVTSSNSNVTKSIRIRIATNAKEKKIHSLIKIPSSFKLVSIWFMENDGNKMNSKKIFLSFPNNAIPNSKPFKNIKTGNYFPWKAFQGKENIPRKVFQKIFYATKHQENDGKHQKICKLPMSWTISTWLITGLCFREQKKRNLKM